MGGRKKKSKKRSGASSKPQPKSIVFFIDRNLGRNTIAQALRDAAIQVEVHDDHLKQDAPDEEWIAFIAEKGWVGVTMDKNIRYRQYEREAIIEHNASVLIVRAKNVTAEKIADILIKSEMRIERFIKKHKPPLVAAIYADGALKHYPLD